MTTADAIAFGYAIAILISAYWLGRCHGRELQSRERPLARRLGDEMLSALNGISETRLFTGKGLEITSKGTLKLPDGRRFQIILSEAA